MTFSISPHFYTGKTIPTLNKDYSNKKDTLSEAYMTDYFVCTAFGNLIFWH